MIEKTISTGLMQPGERKTLRMEWNSPIEGDYIPAVFGSQLVQSFTHDADGMTVELENCLPENIPVEHMLTFRALTSAWVEAH